MIRRNHLASVLLLLSLFSLGEGARRKILTFKRQEPEEKVAVEEEEQICDRTINGLIPQKLASALTSTVVLSIHRNGETEECGSLPTSARLMESALQSFKPQHCPPDGKDLDKYTMETLLTAFVNQQLSSTSCESTDEARRVDLPGFLSFCDRGFDRTTPQPDSYKLKEVPSTGSLPCRFYTREGVRVSSLQQLATLVKNSTKAKTDNCGGDDAGASPSVDDANDSGDCTASSAPKLELYAVPAGRVFMFAPRYVGEIFHLDHVRDKMGNPLALEVLLLSPRVFEIHNLLDKEEAQGLVDGIVSETRDHYRLKPNPARSRRRTTDIGWNVEEELAQRVKRRAFSVMGFDEYHESHTDGLQFVRYNRTKAYSFHTDFMDENDEKPYDYRSWDRGGNRFASVLLYLTDREGEYGGETVFPRRPNPDATLGFREMMEKLRTEGYTTQLTKDSWEEELTAMCQIKFHVTPKKSRAIFFYSQLPNGTFDEWSYHAGCPVLKGTKFMSNLWIWNAARSEWPYAPFKLGEEQQVPEAKDYSAVSVLFFNSGQNPMAEKAGLYWQDQFVGTLGPGESIRMKSYVGHVWHVKDRYGNPLQSWKILEGDPDGHHFWV